MREVIFRSIFVIVNFLATSGFSQMIYLETFDKKSDINKWSITNNGVLKHTNHFTFNGSTYYKNTKDSFVAFYDTSSNINYAFVLKKKFKAIPAGSIKSGFSIFSMDTLKDFLLLSYRIADKKNKTLYVLSYPLYCRQSPVNIAGSGTSLPDKTDTIWQKADSMTITFQFWPANPNKFIERIVVFDDIYLSDIYASMKNNTKSTFQIFPNPASKIVNFKFDSYLKPKQICLYDYTGRLIKTNKGDDKLDVENVSTGFYFVTVLFDNGNKATQKVEIK